MTNVEALMTNEGGEMTNGEIPMTESCAIRSPKWVLALLCIGVLALLPGCARTVGSAGDFRAVIQHAQERVFPALVFVKPIKQHLAAGERVRQQTFGSGVIISEDGLIVTNSHVAKDATEIKCVLFSREQLPARVVGLDTDTDLALLQLELPPDHPPLPTVELGDSSRLREGQFVTALGSPFGFTRSISFGVVSCTRRYLDVGLYTLWIQTDAAINPGNSGGPLVNDRGEVVGINTLRTRFGENIGFAIPANTVKRVVAALRESGQVERAYSGIQFQPVKDFMRDTILDYDRGVLVAGVDERSPAAKAGLNAGDLIVECNRKEVAGLYLEDLPEVRCVFASLPPGKPATLKILRGGARLELEMVPTRKQSVDQEGLELEMWNCSAQEISKFRTPGLAYFVPRGVYILGVRRPGNAHASGLRPGDIISVIDNEPVPTLESLHEVYRQLSRLERGRRTVLFEVLRQGYRHYLVLDFNADYKAFE